MRNATLFLLVMLNLAWLAACSIPPAKPVTRDDLLKTGIYRRYDIQESPEEVLRAINAHGEVILEGKRNIRGKNYPVYVKILAMPGKLEVVDYDR